ncbi:MAG: DUF2142 domain-containing protein [Clostridia bacterium]|nr:DUF2142 domain-containing protein [Clostridia bacterium]
MTRFLNKKNLTRAGLLVLAALILAVGLELLMQHTLPPIYPDREMDLSSDPTLIERGTVFTDGAGRQVLKEEWDPLRLAVTFFLQLGILIAVFPLGLGKRFLAFLGREARGLKEALRKDVRRNLRLLLVGTLVGTAVFFLCRAWVQDLYNRRNWMVDWMCALAGLSAAALCMFPGTLGKKPENLFLVMILLYGGLLSFVLPDSTGVSMDDGYHSQHAINYSMLGHMRLTRAEWELMQPDYEKSYRLREWDSMHQRQDELYRAGAYFVTSGFHLNPKEYWMAGHGLGLFLGRLLRLPYWITWSLGRFTGLLLYALLGCWAIHRLKSGKMVLALAWMLPSAVSLAVNYSYDAGVIAGIWLSFSFWLAQWQEPEKRIRNSDIAVILLGTFAACFAKQIYFPIYLIFLFLPRSKFASRRHRGIYTGLVLLAMGLVMANILLPLGASGGQADTRSGNNADTFAQISYILHNPLEYARTLCRYLQEYLDLNQMEGPLLNYGYQGNGNNTAMCMLILAIAAFTDQREEGLQPVWPVRLAGQALLLGTVALMATAMYAWFSQVGSTHFGGMQPRYLVPVIYPSLALMGSRHLRNRMSPAVYNGLLFAGMTFIGFNGVLVTCIEYYL